MRDRELDEKIAKDERLRHMFETQGDGPVAEQTRLDGDEQLIQQPNPEPED